MNERWTEGELIQVLIAYCEIPFGKLHARNTAIVELARVLGRTPNAVALKMVNFASLDPTIDRKGMTNVSKLDREVWQKFFDNIDSYLSSSRPRDFEGFRDHPQEALEGESHFEGRDVLRLTKTRLGQQHFRKMVLASYDNKCAISGLADDRLLVASHIAPWATAAERRLDPRNGVCLSALFDRAFDAGIISISDEYSLMFAADLGRDTIEKLSSMGARFNPPTKFAPDLDLLRAHRTQFGFPSHGPTKPAVGWD